MAEPSWWWAMVVLGPFGLLLIAFFGWAARRYEWRGAVNSEVGTLNELMTEIRQDIKGIFERLPPRPVASGNPVRLTEFGEKIAATFKAQEWAEPVADTYTDLPNIPELMIDDLSRHYVEKELSDRAKIRVAEVAYEFGIKREDVLAVLQVVLRDEIMKRRAKPEGSDR